MDHEIVVVLLLAALLHSSWHAMIKSSGDRLIGLAGMNVVSASVSIMLLPFVSVPAAGVWPILLLSMVLHAGYKFGLAQVYRHGDLSQAYPIARGVSPIFATAIAFVALGESPGPWQAMGILLISGGVIAMSLERSEGALSLALLATAAATGFMVAAYSVVDAYGTRIGGDWLSFTIWLMVLDGGGFVVLISMVRGRGLWRTLVRERGRTLVSGLLGVAAFSAFLWALSRGAVGGVSALRETSVLFASLIGIAVLKERWSAARLVGAALITLGIVIFALGIGV